MYSRMYKCATVLFDFYQLVDHTISWIIMLAVCFSVCKYKGLLTTSNIKISAESKPQIRALSNESVPSFTAIQN